jgi:integrase
MSRFSSALAQKLEAMLAYRTARGYKEATHLPSLLLFDKFCAEYYPQSYELTSEIVYDWIDTVSELGTKTFYDKATAIRQFGFYLNAIDEDAFVLPKKLNTNRSLFAIYNFTDDELTALFTAIDQLSVDPHEPFLTEIAPVLFRLTYTCGLRPNESRTLLAKNVNIDSGELLITNTKYKVDRYVVMSDGMREMCCRYDSRRAIFGSQSEYFFPAKNGGALTSAKILAALNEAWMTAMCSPNNPTPKRIRIYDLRHRFASACLNRWLDENRNLMSMLPYLRTYMGHRSLNETAHYIHILPENLAKSSAVDWNKFNAMFPEVTI